MTASAEAQPASSAFEAPASAPAAAAPLATQRLLAWSVRRELWENRAIFIAPLSAAGVVLFGFLLGSMGANHISATWAFGPGRESGRLAGPPGVFAFAVMGIVAAAIVVTTVIVGAFYALGALHNERRDRSILFWKSLPVSDLTTVLAKAAIPLVVLPLVALGVIIATQLLVLALGAVAALMHGHAAGEVWNHLPLARLWLLLGWGVFVLALWYAPIWSWLLLVGGWARRTPILWAVLPPLALVIIERIAFGTTYLGDLLGKRLDGALDAGFTGQSHGHIGPGGSIGDVLPRPDVTGFLATPGLWIGLLVAAAFLILAVRLRRHQGPL